MINYFGIECESESKMVLVKTLLVNYLKMSVFYLWRKEPIIQTILLHFNSKIGICLFYARENR